MKLFKKKRNTDKYHYLWNVLVENKTNIYYLHGYEDAYQNKVKVFGYGYKEGQEKTTENARYIVVMHIMPNSEDDVYPTYRLDICQGYGYDKHNCNVFERKAMDTLYPKHDDRVVNGLLKVWGRDYPGVDY